MYVIGRAEAMLIFFVEERNYVNVNCSIPEHRNTFEIGHWTDIASKVSRGSEQVEFTSTKILTWPLMKHRSSIACKGGNATNEYGDRGKEMTENWFETRTENETETRAYHSF